jgi:hypothetical protein
MFLPLMGGSAGSNFISRFPLASDDIRSFFYTISRFVSGAQLMKQGNPNSINGSGIKWRKSELDYQVEYKVDRTVVGFNEPVGRPIFVSRPFK